MVEQNPLVRPALEVDHEAPAGALAPAFADDRASAQLRSLRFWSCVTVTVPARLESSTERIRALHERNGFVLTETFEMPAGGPPLREMWRDPATTAARADSVDGIEGSA